MLTLFLSCPTVIDYDCNNVNNKMGIFSLIERDHQLEKLEFALAISQFVGDKIRSDQLKILIKKIRITYEKPGF